MFSLTYALVFGLCAVASAQVNYTVSIYDYSVERQSNNSIFYKPFSESFNKNSSYQFADFPAGFHNYTDYPTLVVYQPDGMNETAGYYFPKGVLNIFSYGKNTTFYDKYKPIRDYFLAGNRVAFTPKAAFYGYKKYFQYYLKKFIYGSDIPTDFAVLFASSPVEIVKNNTEVLRYGYNGDVFVKQYEFVK